MNENMKKWVETLRTTDLPQGKGYLHSDVGYCCLGIGCIVADILESGDGHFAGCDRAAPIEFVQWLGIEHIHGFSDGHDTEHDLCVDWGEFADITSTLYRDDPNLYTVAAMNDSGFTFAQIADVVEYFGIARAI